MAMTYERRPAASKRECIFKRTTVQRPRGALVASRSRPHRARQQRAAPTQALFGDLLQRLGPGNTAWPPWQLATEPTRSGRKAKLLGEDLRQMRRLLEGCRLEQQLKLPTQEDLLPAAQQADQQDALVAAALHADPSCAASNAVPFSSGAISGGAMSGSSSSSSSSSSGGLSHEAALLEPARAFFPILPCLFAAEGRLDSRSVEFLASSLALSRLQMLDFARVRDGLARCLPDNVYWCGPAPFPSCRVAAAAMLRRMVARRGSLLDGLPEVAGHAIVLVYTPQDRQLAAESVALYLYLYCGFDLEQAAKEARLSMGTPVQPEALLPCLEELASAVAGWQRRVKLVWPYGGGRVELSGEAVGGWDRKVSLAFDVQHRHWVLWLWGLSPGVYRCKFIVDGRWCVDMAAPSESDGRGNVNNLVAAPDGPLPPPHMMQRKPQRKPRSSVDEEADEAVSAAAAAAAGAASGGGGGSGSGSGGPQGLDVAPLAAATVAVGKQWQAAGAPPPALLGAGPAMVQAVPGPAAAVDDRRAEQEMAANSGEGGGLEAALSEARPRSRRVEEQEGDVVRFGALLLAFYTKLSVQRRIPAALHS